MMPIEDNLQEEIEELRKTVSMLRRQGRYMPVMTLREHYAGLAMQGIETSGYGSKLTSVEVADIAKKRADALIAALQETE